MTDTLPLQGLQLFASAARHLNFTLVADEFGTSQPAVSQRIAALEKLLGVALFERSRRGVTLTPEGNVLHEAVREHLAAIGTALERIRSGSTRAVLTVATDFAFANFWLMPRLAAFQQIEPELDVRVVTSQNEFDVRDGSVDLAVSFGTGQWPGCDAVPILPEVVVPVCSPALLAREHAGGAANPAPGALLRLPLLHLGSSGRSRWMTWQDWAQRQGLPAQALGAGQSLTLGNYPLLIQAAIAGRGVALGWRPLIDDLLHTGQLVSLAAPVTTARGYFLVRPQGRAGGRALERLCDWIVRDCERAQPVHAPGPERAPSNKTLR
jgi:LysR family glycine cleavage system transcriptional activator